MEAVAWTAIGLLAVAVFGNMTGLYYLGNRIDAQGAALNARIDGLSARIDSRMDLLEAASTRSRRAWLTTSAGTPADAATQSLPVPDLPLP